MADIVTEASADLFLDQELVPLLAGFPDIPLNAETLIGFRESVNEVSVLPDPASHPSVTIEEVLVPSGASQSPEAPVRCLLYRPTSGAVNGALLHIHGGGFVMGVPEMDALRNAALVQETGCVVLSVDYRLAPENPHPAGLEDCHTGLVWLAAQAGALGFDAAKIGVIGESAGGGFAGSLALLARDRGSVKLAAMALIYPMATLPGDEVEATKNDSKIGRYIWPESSNKFGWECLVKGVDFDRETLIATADNVGNLPPAFVAAAELDLFAHDNLAFASRLMAAGNQVEAHCYPGAFHAFDRMAEAQVAQHFTRDLVSFLRRHLA